MDKIFNVMDRMFKLEYIGVLFIAFGFGMFLGIIGYVENLEVIGYTEIIKIYSYYFLHRNHENIF